MKKIDELNQLYKDSEEVDKDLFAEQRSNVLMVAGEHYAKGKSKFFDRIKTSTDISENQKIRITKNHIQRITKIYRNNILAQSPGVKVIPNNMTEIQDQKTAELNDSVRLHIQKKNELDDLIDKVVSDFIEIGEMSCKIFWDANKGEFLGYAQEVDESGQPVFETDELGQQTLDAQGKPIPVASKNGVFSGGLVHERILGFNLLRAKEAKTITESPYLIYRKMVNVNDMKKIVGNDEEKLKMIKPSRDETYMVFDAQKAEYRESKTEMMLKEFYYRPCVEYPKGYFYICVEGGILFEGELPLGIFPIIYEGFDEMKTSPRHRAIIKQLRPYQAEINREASQQAMNSIVHGDDKVLVQSGTKLTNGAMLPGIRQVNYTGMTPQVVPGRAGEQFINSINNNIDEMYKVANVAEDSEEIPAQLDPYTLLFRSIKNKKKYMIYSSKVERFLVKMWEISLELARGYMDESHLIPMIGKKEYVNIAEFKNADKRGSRIQIEPMSDDMDTMMGKQLMINHVLQYAGSNLGKEDIGKLMRVSPFANEQEAFEDFTIDYDCATNDILALERGEQPFVNPYGELEYTVNRLTHRMKQADFRMLDPQIISNFQAYEKQLQDAIVERERNIQALKDSRIPIDGFLVTVQLKRTNPETGKQDNIRLPYSSIQWLVDSLDKQGASQDNLEQMNQGALAEASNMMLGQLQGQGQSPTMPQKRPMMG
jgi:hypothetical protein